MKPHGKRPVVAALDALVGKQLKVLDDGFVRLVDYMGDEGAVVQAARVSYGVGTKRVHEDRGLLRYLMRHGHTTPFEMCEIKLHVRAPMDTWRQWIRHRTASVNEYSTRYSVAIDAAQRTAADQWRAQSTASRQGSGAFLSVSVGKGLSAAERGIQKEARKIYEARLESGVAREQARKDLPLSTYTEAYWKIDLHNLLHFLLLRMDNHAQEEIRSYAMTIGEKIVAHWVPAIWESFLDYRMRAVVLSRIEVQVLSAMNTKAVKRALRLASDRGMLRRGPDGNLTPNRERSEMESKMRALGLKPPWDE